MSEKLPCLGEKSNMADNQNKNCVETLVKLHAWLHLVTATPGNKIGSIVTWGQLQYQFKLIFRLRTFYVKHVTDKFL